MAIFIPHIKGCEKNSNIYTWIKILENFKKVFTFLIRFDITYIVYVNKNKMNRGRGNGKTIKNFFQIFRTR